MILNAINNMFWFHLELCLKAVNTRRSRHIGTYQVSWDERVAENAQEWAEDSLRRDTLGYDPQNFELNYGETHGMVNLNNLNNFRQICDKAIRVW